MFFLLKVDDELERKVEKSSQSSARDEIRFFIRVNRKILPASELHLHARFQ